jgi:hypothetical protein
MQCLTQDRASAGSAGAQRFGYTTTTYSSARTAVPQAAARLEAEKSANENHENE